jgi:hypothetical protein
VKYRIINRARHPLPPECAPHVGKTTFEAKLQPHREGCLCTLIAIGYDLEHDMRPIIRGDVAVPNFESQDLALVVNNLAALGHRLEPQWGYALLEAPTRSKDWAFYFLDVSDGEGWVLIYTPQHQPARAGRFAICRHRKVSHLDANHSRGWHPGHCELCGIDMTVDSSD